MCFAPPRRADFPPLNVQNWFLHVVLCDFRLEHVLRATPACNFSSLVWLAGSAPAACATLYFSTLRRHRTLEKHSVSRLAYLFAHLHLLASDCLHGCACPSLICFLLTFSMAELLPGWAFPFFILSGMWCVAFFCRYWSLVASENMSCFLSLCHTVCSTSYPFFLVLPGDFARAFLPLYLILNPFSAAAFCVVEVCWRLQRYLLGKFASSSLCSKCRRW